MWQTDEPRQQHKVPGRSMRLGESRATSDRQDRRQHDRLGRTEASNYELHKKKTGEALSDEVTTRDTGCKALMDRVSQKDTDATP